MEILNCDADIRLTNLRDEELVALVTQSGFREAGHVLLLRHREWSRRLIMRLARHRGLSSHDTEDALQDAMFAILKAICRYETVRPNGRNGCLFQAFLGRVLTNRFKDFVKHLRRTESRFSRPMPRFLELNEPFGRREDRGTSLLEDKESDPAVIAQRKELVARVRNAVANLDGINCRLVHGLLSGRRLRAVADELGITYDMARRRWRGIRARFARHLAELVN
jgi:RNA polymerase sigma factor (sigma-70 family)